MLAMLTTMDLSLPLQDPVIKFFIVLLIMLLAPVFLDRFRIPPLLGLIIAGAVIGPHGFNIIDRDSGIIMSGTAGLLYIMFLAGLEIDMQDFKRNSWKSLVFGMYTFLIPMGLGTLAGIYLLGYDVVPSVLLASMLASHTLIAYVIVSKMGLSKDPSVTITVGGTMITDTLALLVLTVIVGMNNGVVDRAFWIRLGVSITLFVLVILLLFPPLCRWFFKKFNDSILQYVFVLVLLFAGAIFAQLAGMEAILGAFIVGIALNRLIPRTSPLMNRIDFVGNAIFIPFFLISVGMLIDYKAFFSSFETIKVGVVMIVVATAAKYAAAWLTQKTFGFSKDQRRVIFGLSNAQAAATLAAVLVGYNVGILNEAVLNGTILMILVTCTMASFSAQKGAHNMAADMRLGKKSESTRRTRQHLHRKVLMAVGSDNTLERLVNFSVSIRGKSDEEPLYAVKVVDEASPDENRIKTFKSQLSASASMASASDVAVTQILRYDLNVHNAVSSVVNELDITDLVYGQSAGKDISVNDLRRINENVLNNAGINVFVYRSVQPLSTVRRHVVLMPDYADVELGFEDILGKIASVAKDSGVKAVVYASDRTLDAVRQIYGLNGPFIYMDFPDWNALDEVTNLVRNDEMLWVVMSRPGGVSYIGQMSHVPEILARHAAERNYVIAYPRQAVIGEGTRYYT